MQSAFFPLRFTAHIANELTYKAINRDFHFTFQAGGNEFHGAHGGKRVDDDENMFWTLTVLRRWKPVYMRVHLQDTGAMGGRSRPDIWAANSPYRQALAKADAHLGTLIEELKKLGMYDSTLIFVTGDHGQTVEGGHPPFAQDAWPMPLVVAGPGVKAGGRFPYSEQIDVVPTLTYLMGVKPPDNAMGRIMAEALMNPPANVPPATTAPEGAEPRAARARQKAHHAARAGKDESVTEACSGRPRAELSGRGKNSSLVQSGIG